MDAWKTAWAVSLDGRDISSAMNPYLQSIEINDKDGTASDTCALTLDDSNGQFRMPRAGGLIAVTLEGVQCFQGTIDEINSTGGRSQGRQISINAKGFDTRGKVKSRLDFHLDDATLQQFLDAAARRAGIDGVIVDPAYGDSVTVILMPEALGIDSQHQRRVSRGEGPAARPRPETRP